MAGPANARGGLGWVILVIALAVPGVLFYNWWSHLKADREKAVAAKARGRVPEGGVFTSSPNAKLVNPMTPASAPAATTASASPADAQAASPAATLVSVAPQATPSPAQAATSVVSGAAAVAPGALGAAEVPAASSMTVAAPLKRDPTLSPFDQVRLLEEEEAKARAARDLAEASRPRSGSKRGPAPVRDPSTQINLQGIVSNPDSGFKAIVNDEVLGAGELVGNTKIKIVKITDLGVTFEFRGKRFSKGVSRD